MQSYSTIIGVIELRLSGIGYRTTKARYGIGNSTVTLIMTLDFLKTLEAGFAEFFEKEVPANSLKAEYLIPTFIGELLVADKMFVKVLRSNDTWYGMTYKEDVEAVKDSFKKMLDDGVYKEDLFADL